MAEEGKLKIVALGDSTTAGTPGFLSPREAPPDGSGDERSQYAYWIMQEHPDWEVLNRGVRGQRTDQILKRFEYDVLRLEPDALVLLAGINDLHQGYPASQVRENLQKMYEAARKNGIPAAACSILPYNLGTAEVHQRIVEVNRWIRDYAEKNGLVFCDTYEAVHDDASPGRLVSSDDDIHPDIEGYRKMAVVISEALEKIFAKRQGK